MKRQRWVMIIVLLALAYGGRSCEKLSISGHTVGTVHFIRPVVTLTSGGVRTAIFEDTRFLPDTRIETSAGSRSSLALDSGVRMVVDGGTSIDVVSTDEIRLASGRIFIDADEKEQVLVRTGEGKLTVIGSNVSIQSEGGQVTAYTCSGELTYAFPGGNGVARAGESIGIKGKEVEIAPEELWTDWTGGMAEAGPQPMETPVSIGQIYARPPGSSGTMRSPLIIRRHEVRITIKGDLAITETMQQFFNPSSQVMEGIYRLRIPQDGMLQRFAVDRNGKLVEGYIKERRAAKEEYQAYVYQGSPFDPALLEWVAPGSFKASIYPIKPGQVRTIAYTYSQWLVPSGKDGTTRTYVYPIGNETIPPQVGEFYLVADVSDAGTQIVQAGAGARIEKGRVVFAQSDFRPRSDFFIQLMNVESELKHDEVRMVKTDYRGVLGKLKGKRDETYARTQFVLRDDTLKLSPDDKLRISVAIDMSAATEQQMVDLAATLLDSIFGQLHEEDRIAVFAGDIDADIVGVEEKKLVKATPQVKEAILDAVSRRSIGGATDIGNLIVEAASVSAGEPGGIVVYVGDGFPTVGELDLGSLKERIKRLPNPVRLYGVALGDEANLDLLAGLCAGRGLAARIETRVEAAGTALDILADASTPVIENVTYEIDGGIERVYPAEITTLKITQPVQLIGRLTGEKDPKAVTVKGTMYGKPFQKTYKVVMKAIDDFGDLRMRWAEKRLASLLDEMEGPESVIELGTRYGIITPYTSFYVPPEDQCADLPEVQPFEIYNFIEGAQASAGGGEETTLAEAVAGILLPYGCSRKEEPYKAEEKPADREAMPVEPPTVTVTSSPPAAAVEIDGEMAERKAMPKAGYKSDYDSPVGASSGTGGGYGSPKKKAKASHAAPAPDESGVLAILGSKGEPDLMAKLEAADASVGDDLKKKLDEIAGYSKTKIYVEQETYTTTPATPVDLTGKVKQCEEASLMPIDEKVDLWKERIGGNTSVYTLMSVFGEAKKRCEIKSAKDQRAFARMALGLLGSVSARCGFYQEMKKYPALAGFIKGKILAGLSTPESLKTAMEQCDGGIWLSRAEIDKLLLKAKDMDAKVVILKKLVTLYPFDLDLKVMLLDMLEDAGRKEEALRFADMLRKEPYITDDIRTRIGEFFLRAGEKVQAKRIFSEIVEFAPWSYAARRRLGDLYRTYGWYEDAYRQYETLSQMAPNDDGVLVLLAESAILAGRADEGLRILQQVSQSEPSYEGKITPAEIARVIASLELVGMRIKARAGNDQKKLKQVMDRTRSIGVLRDAGDLKVVLKWDHPDAAFDLSIKFPGSELAEPSRSAPAMGLEWIVEKSLPAGNVLLQVERAPGSVVKESKAVLYILTREGKDDEKVSKVAVDLTKKDKPKLAWTFSPDGKIAEAKVEKGEPFPAL
jgi:hypothetical protein